MWTTCCSPVSWCSNGGKGTHLQRRSRGIARKKRQGSRGDGASVRFRRAAHQSDPVARARRDQQELRRSGRRIAGRIARTRCRLALRLAGIGQECRPAGRLAGARHHRGGAPQAVARICLRHASSRRCCWRCWMGSSAAPAAPTRIRRPRPRLPRSDSSLSCCAASRRIWPRPGLPCRRWNWNW